MQSEGSSNNVVGFTKNIDRRSVFNALLLGLIFVVASGALIYTFEFYAILASWKIPEFRDFVFNQIGSNWIGKGLVKLHLYFSFSFLANSLSILTFFACGIFISRLIKRYKVALMYFIVLALSFVPKILFDSVIVLGFPFSILNILMWVTSVYALPLWGILGFYVGRRWLLQSHQAL